MRCWSHVGVSAPRLRVAVAVSVLLASVGLLAGGVSAQEVESDGRIEVSSDVTVVVDSSQHYIIGAPELSWSVPASDPDNEPSGFEVRRTHQESGEQVTFCLGGDADGLVDGSIRYTNPQDPSEFVAGAEDFTYEVRATGPTGTDHSVTLWSEPLSVTVHANPLSPREVGVELSFGPAVIPARCTEHRQSEESVATQGGGNGGDSTKSARQPDPDPDPDDPSGDTEDDCAGTKCGPTPDTSVLPTCGQAPTEACTVGNATWNPPDESPPLSETPEGKIPVEDTPGWVFPWTQCYNTGGQVFCTR